MQANFYKNLSDNRVVNKDIYVTVNGLDITLKDNCDILNPNFILNVNNKILNSNYMWVSDLNRFYYIENIELSQQRMFIKTKVDVLMTYKSEILNLNCIIKRQSNRYNTYLNDDEYKSYEYNRIQTFPFSRGFTAEEFILAVSGF